VHHRGRPLAVTERAHLLDDVFALLSGRLGIAPLAMPFVPWQLAQLAAT